MTTLARVAALLLIVLASGAAADDDLAPRTASRFVPVDIYVDSGTDSLAAWQVQFTTSGKGTVKLVGVEGGAHAAFGSPPAYDPAALEQDRVILAAFNTGADLPSGRTRVARLHLHVTGTPQYSIELAAAGDADGRRIEAEASMQEGTPE